MMQNTTQRKTHALTLARLATAAALRDRLPMAITRLSVSSGHLFILVKLMEASLRCQLLAISAKQTAAVQDRIRLQVLVSAAICFLIPTVALAHRHCRHEYPYCLRGSWRPCMNQSVWTLDTSSCAYIIRLHMHALRRS